MSNLNFKGRIRSNYSFTCKILGKYAVPFASKQLAITRRKPTFRKPVTNTDHMH